MNAACPLCDKLQHLTGDVVWTFPHSVALLGPWQYYTGYCVLVARHHAAELYDLSPTDRHAFLDEMVTLAQAIAAAFVPRKMNYELLGNQVPHLHWHLFPRRSDDADALNPVWTALERAERDPAERTRLETATLTRLEIADRLRHELHVLQAKRV